MRAVGNPDPNTDQFVLQSIKKRPGRHPAEEDSTEPTTREAVAADEAPKRKRGRPKGSKNRPKVAA